MSFYLDSSIIVSFFVPDAHSGRADALHLALSTTSQLTLATFDQRLASAASLRGQAVLVP
jgi:predicted nucleic acid-binding protein